MSAALLRVSVVAGGRRLDVAVPAALPVAELVPGLAQRLGAVSYDGLRLSTVTGAVLDDADGLGPQDVSDGAVLVLAPPPPPVEVHDDPVDALAQAAPPSTPTGAPGWPLPVGGALLLLAAVPLAVAGLGRIAAAAALLLLAAALALGRVRPGAAVVVAVAACGHAAVAAAVLAADLRPGAGVVWAASGGAVLAVASLVMAGLPSHRLRLLPAVVVAATAAVIGATLAIRDVPLGAVAAVVLGLGAVLTAGLPWVAVGRITRPRGRVDVEALAAEARAARELLVGGSTGLALVHAGLAPVVAWGGPAGMALVGCASMLIMLRARHLPTSREALPGVLAGSLGLLAALGVGLSQHEAWHLAGAAALAAAGVAVLVHAWSPRALNARDAALLVPPLLRGMETACLVALVPLLALASGALESLR